MLHLDDPGLDANGNKDPQKYEYETELLHDTPWCSFSDKRVARPAMPRTGIRRAIALRTAYRYSTGNQRPADSPATSAAGDSFTFGVGHHESGQDPCDQAK